MKNLRNPYLSVFLLALLFIITQPATLAAQATYTNRGVAKVQINGTSNIQDWNMKTEKGTCEGIFIFNGAGQLTGITDLSFTLPVYTLKSQKGSQMDNNAYKAMASDKYPNITFSSSNVTVTYNGGANYSISAQGRMEISSGARDITLVATGILNSDKSVIIKGSYKLVTTDYNVSAISIMLGAVKTSPDVSIDYTLTMKAR